MATSNVHKAAVFLLSLPKEQNEQLLGRLEPQQAAAVTAEMGLLREVDPVEQESVVQEFAATNAVQGGACPSEETAPFEFLYDVESDVLLAAIADEHPQAIAMILSHLPSRQAAAVLAGLSPDVQLSVICRTATMSEADPEVVRDVEDGLRRRLAGTVGRPADHRGVACVIRMLNAMEPAAERKLLGSLAETAPELVREIRRTMFGVDVDVCGEWNVAGAAG